MKITTMLLVIPQRDTLEIKIVDLTARLKAGILYLLQTVKGKIEKREIEKQFSGALLHRSTH
jgi:hypothetical protein